MKWLWKRAPVEDPGESYKYAITIDAGSSGSRLEIYTWLDNKIAIHRANATERAYLPMIKAEGKQEKVHPGISTFSDSPSNVGRQHLEPLLNYALEHVPERHQSSTPLFLLATAGMRLLSPQRQQAILSSACAYAREHTPFLLPDCDAHFQVIDGKTEGLYGWISINYLLGSFDRPELHNHGKGHTSYGFIDMGGASAQVAFAPNTTESERHAEDLMLLRLRTLDGIEKEYRVFVSTWLGYGVTEVRKRYIRELESHTSTGSILQDPCLPNGLELPVENTKWTIHGTGSLSDCLYLQTPLLEKNMDCLDDPCLFGGVHAPAIDFDVNHFIGVSEYWHTTHDVFDMGGAYDYATYSRKVKDFCSRNWDSILDDLDRGKWGQNLNEEKAKLVCFKAAWIMNVLHDGFGIPRLTKEFQNVPGSSHNSTQDLIDSAKSHGFLNPFQSMNKIDGVEFTWTLGKVVLYASSTVNSATMSTDENLDVDHMVGFGPNNDQLYVDGEFYSSTGLVVSVESTWPLSRLRDTFGRRVPGLFLFLTMICVVVWLVIGKERRNRVLASTTRKWFKRRRKVMGAGGVYERLEAGEIDDDLDDEVGGRAWALHELRPPKLPKSQTELSAAATTSGSASPRFDVPVATVTAASSIVRSESRERLPSRPGSRASFQGRMGHLPF